MGNTNQQIEPIPITPPNQTDQHMVNNKKGIFIFIIGLVAFVLILIGLGGYFFLQKDKTAPSQSSIQQTKIESKTDVQPDTQAYPAVLTLRDRDLLSVQLNDLSSKKLTNGGGFYTSNQHGYWSSPDQTKFISKQNKTLLLITKDGSKPILQIEPKGDVNNIAWRNDSNALVIWQVLKYEEYGIGLPILSEILTYDLQTGKSTRVKEYKGFGGVVIWDSDSNSIGYKTGGGEGGSFGDYHVINLNTKSEKTFQTRWTNPSMTPDRKEFIVFADYDEQGNSSSKSIKVYSILDPDKPLRTFKSPKEHFSCLHQSISNVCLGNGKSFWFLDETNIKSFDSQSGKISDVITLPAINITVPSGAVPISASGDDPLNVLDSTKDQGLLLIERQTSFGHFEYQVYDAKSGQVKSIGFYKIGTTQSNSKIGKEGELWTEEALGFIY